MNINAVELTNINLTDSVQGRTMRLSPAAAWVCTHLAHIWEEDEEMLEKIRACMEQEVLGYWINESLFHYNMAEYVDFDVADHIRLVEAFRDRVLVQQEAPMSSARVLLWDRFFDMFNDDTQEVLDTMIGGLIVLRAMNRVELYPNMTGTGFQEIINSLIHALKQTSPAHERVLDFVNYHMANPLVFIREIMERLCGSLAVFQSLASPDSDMVHRQADVRIGPETLDVKMFRDPVFPDLYYAMGWETGSGPIMDVDLFLFKRESSWLEFARARFSGMRRRDLILHAVMQIALPLPHAGARVLASGLFEYMNSPDKVKVGEVALSLPYLNTIRLFSRNVAIDIDLLFTQIMRNIYSQRLNDLCNSVEMGKDSFNLPMPLKGLEPRFDLFGGEALSNGIVDWKY